MILLGFAQITSEQIVREAKELQEKDFKAPTQHISNEAELGEYRLRKRKEWEDVLRMKRWNLSIWAMVRSPAEPLCRAGPAAFADCALVHQTMRCWLEYGEMASDSRLG